LNLNSTTQKIKELWKAIWKTPGVAAVVSFIGEAEGELKNEAPLMIHTSKKVVKDTARPIDVVYTYESASSPSFILPSHKHYDAVAAGVAHTRSLAFLKKHLGGPNFDLEAIWDEHTKFEFGERDVEKTMATMVEEPYVNHVPTVNFPSQNSASLLLTICCGIDDRRCWKSCTYGLLP
jgi:carboxymethylenebutenolidase